MASQRRGSSSPSSFDLHYNSEQEGASCRSLLTRHMDIERDLREEDTAPRRGALCASGWMARARKGKEARIVDCFLRRLLRNPAEDPFQALSARLVHFGATPACRQICQPRALQISAQALRAASASLGIASQLPLLHSGVSGQPGILPRMHTNYEYSSWNQDGDNQR